MPLLKRKNSDEYGMSRHKLSYASSSISRNGVHTGKDRLHKRSGITAQRGLR